MALRHILSSALLLEYYNEIRQKVEKAYLKNIQYVSITTDGYLKIVQIMQ